MAGFAVVMTIFTYGIIGILGAGVFSLFLFFSARRKLRDAGRTDRGLIVKTALAQRVPGDFAGGVLADQVVAVTLDHDSSRH